MFLLFFQSAVRRLLGVRATARHAQLASAEVEDWPTCTATVIDGAPLSVALSASTRARAGLGTAPRHTATLVHALV